ncbi:hypothetical protein P3S68_030726 [Capsicum galapagoense]
MANFIADTNKKIQDLFVYIVSCGKSSKGPPRNDQELAKDAPLVDDFGLQIFIPKEDQSTRPTNTSDVPQINEQDQGLIVVIPPVQENIEQQKQEQKQENGNVIEPLPIGFIPEGRANVPQPPGKREFRPIFRTGEIVKK